MVLHKSITNKTSTEKYRTLETSLLNTHKHKYRKSRLKIYLGDRYDSSLTEQELMKVLSGYNRCYNSGKIKYELTVS